MEDMPLMNATHAVELTNATLRYFVPVHADFYSPTINKMITVPRDAFEANSAHSPLPWGRVPKAAGGFAEMGQSLLRPLPPERDCVAAGIPQSVCRLERRAGGG